MDEYISLEAAIKSTWMILEGMGYPRSGNRSLDQTVESVFKSAPAADVVEVVRCKECKFNEDKGNGHAYQWCCQSNKYRPSDWFCADGVREDDNG